MSSASASAPSGENRSEGRSNVFLGATLESGGRSAAVRVRNISAHGALIDGQSLPSVGARVRLVRGGLWAVGQLAWAGGDQAGMNFESEIDVAAWVQRVGHSGQEQVDKVIAGLRSGGSAPADPQVGADARSLAAISGTLDQICERLAQSGAMSVEFGEELIRLEAVAHWLRQLATASPQWP